jgi:hypothetical protein
MNAGKPGGGGRGEGEGANRMFGLVCLGGSEWLCSAPLLTYLCIVHKVSQYKLVSIILPFIILT